MKYNGKFKVVYGLPKFHINTKKGTVVCILEGHIKTPFILTDDWLDSIDYPKVPQEEIKGQGIAKCKPTDTFDEARGKKIAYARAETDCHLKAIRYLSGQAKCLNALMEGISEFTDGAYQFCAHNEDYVDSLSFEANPNYVKEVKDVKNGIVVTRK